MVAARRGGHSQQAYACARCTETAIAWIGGYVGAPARWTPLDRSDPRRAIGGAAPNAGH